MLVLNMKKLFLLIIIIVISLTVIISSLIYLNYLNSQLKGFVLDPPKEATDFTLIDQNGSPVSLSNFKGKVIILTFIYTNCPDICPVITANLVKVYQKLVSEGFKDQIATVFVTVDPDRDNVTIMKKYAERFNAINLYFLTNNTAGSTYSGSLTNLRFVWKAYNVYVNINKTDTTEHASEHNHNNENYEVDHTVVTYIIDKKFKIREAFYGVPPLWNSDDMVHDVSVLAKS